MSVTILDHRSFGQDGVLVCQANWLLAVGWASLFVGTRVAIHSTYWHHNYGEPSSRGCVNASPEHAKWIFRWCLPQVPYDPGDVTVEWPGGTKVIVKE